MVHLMRTIDRALGYAFVANNVDDTSASATISPSTGMPRDKVDNKNALFSSAASIFPDAPKIQDIQERWVDYRDEYDEWETGEWRKEGMTIGTKKYPVGAKRE